MDDYSQNNIVTLTFLEGNDPTTLMPSQQFLKPYSELLLASWWLVWTCVLVFMVANYIIKPILGHKNSKKINMNILVKKIIKICTYSFLLVVGGIIAALPFVKKSPEFTSNYSPEIREAQADIPPPQPSDDDDDGSL